jgi:hypothetical protein
MDGKAGRYMSMANGPMADTKPKTKAVRKKEEFMVRSSRKSSQATAVSGNSLQARLKRFSRP